MPNQTQYEVVRPVPAQVPAAVRFVDDGRQTSQIPAMSRGRCALSLKVHQQPTTLDKSQLLWRLRKYFILNRLRTMNAAGNMAIIAPRGGMVKLKVSIRLSSNMFAGIRCSDFVDMCIITNLEDYKDSPGERSRSIMCSLLLQIGHVFGLKRGLREFAFTRTSEHWCLRRSALAGRWESKDVERLKDIKNGDQLVLYCGEHWAFSLVDENPLKGLPFTSLVKVVLTSPLLDRDVNVGSASTKYLSNKPTPVAANTAGIKVHDSRSSHIQPDHTSEKENINDSVANKRFFNKALEKPAESMSHNCRRYDAPDISGMKSSNKDIVMCSDNESDDSSDVEDITDEWRARRDEDRRNMKANAEEID